jgi:hypothetical protein
MCDTSPMSRTSVNRLIQLNINRRNSVNNIDNNSFNNTPITNNTSRLSTALTPFSFISNSFTQDIKDLVNEINWLEICNIIIAIALALMAVSLAILFFDPHLIKSKNLIRKIISLLNKCIGKIKSWFRFISNCKNSHPPNHSLRNISNPSKYPLLTSSLELSAVDLNQLCNICSIPVYDNIKSSNLSLFPVRREFIKWDNVRKIIFKESMINNSLNLLEKPRDLSNTDLTQFTHDILLHLSNISSFHSETTIFDDSFVQNFNNNVILLVMIRGLIL